MVVDPVTFHVNIVAAGGVFLCHQSFFWLVTFRIYRQRIAHSVVEFGCFAFLACACPFLCPLAWLSGLSGSHFQKGSVNPTFCGLASSSRTRQWKLCPTMVGQGPSTSSVFLSVPATSDMLLLSKQP
ncbi:hypothetical protein WJX77_005062 [Trebouxia sp. C0004]